jgi:hypothetical protein
MVIGSFRSPRDRGSMSQHPSAWGRVAGIGAAAALGLASLAGACSSTNRTQPRQAPLPIPALCSIESPRVAAGSVPTLRYEQWARLLLRDYTPGFAAANARDCTNQPVEWREFRGNCAEYCDEPTNQQRPEAERCRVPVSDVVPQRPISDDDVIVTRIGPTLRLVWVITDRYSNGEAVGPVALTEFSDNNRVVVRAIGTVRNYPKRARMRLDTVGERRVLVHEGEICENDDDRTTCRRAARLMLLRSVGTGGARFLPEPLRSNHGRCYGPARFEFQRDANVTLDSGWRRTFQLATAIQVRAEGVQVHETVTVQDRDPSRPDDPPRPYRRAGQDRAVYVVGNTFVSSDPSLWSRVLSQEARVDRIRDAGASRDASADGADVVDGGDDFRGDPMDGGI